MITIVWVAGSAGPSEAKERDPNPKANSSTREETKGP